MINLHVTERTVSLLNEMNIVDVASTIEGLVFEAYIRKRLEPAREEIKRGNLKEGLEQAINLKELYGDNREFELIGIESVNHLRTSWRIGNGFEKNREAGS